MGCGVVMALSKGTARGRPQVIIRNEGEDLNVNPGRSTKSRVGKNRVNWRRSFQSASNPMGLGSEAMECAWEVGVSKNSKVRREPLYRMAIFR